MTSNQCNEIQKDIIGLRTTTKQELDKLQGHLQVFIFSFNNPISNIKRIK